MNEDQLQSDYPQNPPTTPPNTTSVPTAPQPTPSLVSPTTSSKGGWIYFISGLIILILVGLIGFSIWQTNQPTNTAVTVDTGQVVNSTPELTALEWVKSQENTTTLQSLIEVSNSSNLFDSQQARTIFIPTEEAFDKFPQGQLDSYLKGENREGIVDVMRYHMIQGSYSGQDLIENSNLTSIDGLEIKLSGNSKGQIVINDYSVVTRENIRVKNTIIHLVDSVLVPKESQVNEANEVIGVYTGLYSGTATILNPSLVFPSASFSLNPNGNMLVGARELSLEFLNDSSILVDNQYPSMNLLAEGTVKLNEDGTLTMSFSNVGVTFEAGGQVLNNERSNKIATLLANRGITIPTGQGLVTRVQPTLTAEGLRLQNTASQPLLLNMELQKV